jgi:hypothetical protein
MFLCSNNKLIFNKVARKTSKSHRNIFVKWRLPKIPRNLWLSFLHSLFLLLMGYFWLGTSFTFEDEALLIKWTTLIKKDVFGIDPKPPADKVLFINTATSKIPVYTEADALSLKPAVELITDREKLAGMLELLIPIKDSIDLIVLDILFDLPTPGDSILEERFRELGDKILAVSYMPEVDSIVPPLFQVPYALSTYRSSADMYFKYPVAYKGKKTVPTVMYEKTTGSEIVKKGLFFRDHKKYILKSPVTDFKVTLEDFKLGDNLQTSGFAVHHLETLKMMGQFMEKKDFQKLFSGKLVMIGDFSTDIHETVLGPMPGVLVLYNAYLTMLEGDNVMKFGWLLLMIVGFTWISNLILTGKGLYLLNNWKRKFRSGWIHFLIDSVDEILYLAILTLLSYFLFNIQISIMILFIYLKITELVLDFINNRKKRKQILS